ncbi:uroporphyrinogen-III synthase [Mangrovibacterium lignilyticum]|uniref:uroporphyrinogen-III synthase n=1 Tax=Mangrovibacterium lignilyticum TaxID=2668052 RepID=UPI0013D045F1|nr:uroporphyrinogen-III synthase [Mangrovibacterium lignilyticum]
MADRQDANKIHGKIIICTYPKPEPDDFAILLEQSGATVYSMPAIEIQPCSYHLDQNVSNYQWLVFTSKNGVRSFAAELKKLDFNKIAVLGEGTAFELHKLNIEPDYIGTGRSGSDFAEELKQVFKPNESVLLLLGELAPDTIQTKLSATHLVERINVYQTKRPEVWSRECLKLIEENLYDLMIISSPSAIKNLYLALQPKNIDWRIISIGKTTTAACRELQIEPLATAKEATYIGLAETTIEFLQH